MSEVDWLSGLLHLIAVTGQLEVRCAYGAPWRVAWGRSATREIPYHVIIQGTAVIENPEAKTAKQLKAGDIVLIPHGSPHVLHDGSGHMPAATKERVVTGGWTVSENSRSGERLDMLCGRFLIGPPHDRLIRNYLPTDLVVRTAERDAEESPAGASAQLAALVSLMRQETTIDRPGGTAILNSLSAALFALVLRAASEMDEAPKGLLALAGHTRLGPAIAAMFANPSRTWTLPELGEMCGMSRATFVRHFQEALGRSAFDLLTDIRMSMAANELKKPGVSTESVADTVGYQSVAAFRRAFTATMGITPGEWRRKALERT